MSYCPVPLTSPSDCESVPCSKVLSGPVGRTLVRSGVDRDIWRLARRSSSSRRRVSANSAWILSSVVTAGWKEMGRRAGFNGGRTRVWATYLAGEGCGGLHLGYTLGRVG